MSKKKIVVLSGSARTGSLNKKLAAAAASALKDSGAEVQLIDLNNYTSPVYHGDDEESSGLPESMSRLKMIIAESDALVISTPEYNGHVPPLLVNSFSWVSRPEEGDKSSAFDGKIAAIMAASPGALGGVRVIPRLRDFLAELGVTVVPGFVTVKSAYDAFEENGTFKNAANTDAVKALVAKLLAALD